jgi:FdhE protein
MAQLVGKEPGRRRFLFCGCCGTRWSYKRTGCLFCDSQNDHRLSVLVIEGEAPLRIDHCEACSGYLKTYDGEGDENVLLADWTSIHLDIIAQDRGLKRLGTSLYQL